MRRVLILVVCLSVSSFTTAQDSSEKGVDPQTEAIAKQLTSELMTAVRHNNAGDIANDPKGKIAGLDYDVHMSDCENRWVALYHKPEEADYTYGFVYIDPQAGFTLHYFGVFTIDARGDFHVAPNPIPPDKASVKIRLDQNGIAALLPARALTQLQLPQRPDWMKYYEDKADPVTHKVSWGFFYNGIGDSQRALGFLESAYKERPDAPRVPFELTYAYNAVGRPEDAIRVAKSDFAKNPKDELLCREITFAYLNLKNYKDAIEQHQACIALCGDSESQNGGEERTGDEPRFGLRCFG
jgi:tetratricopeptide (TPR) repeat protein